MAVLALQINKTTIIVWGHVNFATLKTARRALTGLSLNLLNPRLFFVFLFPGLWHNHSMSAGYWEMPLFGLLVIWNMLEEIFFQYKQDFRAVWEGFLATWETNKEQNIMSYHVFIKLRCWPVTHPADTGQHTDCRCVSPPTVQKLS